MHYEIDFTYAAGPGVAVVVRPDCVPEVLNGSLGSSQAASVLPLLNRLTR